MCTKTRFRSPTSGRPGVVRWTQRALIALVVFFIVVAIYISFRFEPKDGPGRVHRHGPRPVGDHRGLFALSASRSTPEYGPFAILTIPWVLALRHVVVFDRVRDNTKGFGASGRMTYSEIDQPLDGTRRWARSINTSLVAILPGAGRVVGRSRAARSHHPPGLRAGLDRRVV